jgi:hypothetical protein
VCACVVALAGLSAVDPVAYQKRFCRRVIDLVVRSPGIEDNPLASAVTTGGTATGGTATGSTSGTSVVADSRPA